MQVALFLWRPVRALDGVGEILFGRGRVIRLLRKEPVLRIHARLVGVFLHQRIGLRARRIQLALARQHIKQQQVQLQAVRLHSQRSARGGFSIVELVGVDRVVGAVCPEVRVGLQRLRRLFRDRHTMT